jgi:hypothetical protein
VLVDPHGGVLTATGHTADGRERDGGPLGLPPQETQEQFPPWSPLWVAAGSNGATKGHDWSEKELGWTTQGGKPPFQG